MQAIANRGLQTTVVGGSAGDGPVGSVDETTRRSIEGGAFADERAGMAGRVVGGKVVLACVVDVGSLFGLMVGPVVAPGPVRSAAPAPTLADVEGVDAPVPVFDGIKWIGTTRSHAMPSWSVSSARDAP